MEPLDRIAELELDFEQFQREVELVYDKLVKPTWGGEDHGLHHMLYGCMSRCFSFFDLLSTYWRGSGGEQTNRIVDFICKHLRVSREASRVAVEMWRHKLMHTAEPRNLIGKGTGVEYTWLLHWSKEQLGDAKQFSFSENGNVRILNLALIDLVSDLRNALQGFKGDLSSDPALKKNMDDAEKRIRQSCSSVPII